MGEKPTSEDEIEITPEMTEALDETFWRWYGDNLHALELGGAGKIYDLWLALDAAFKKPAKSSRVKLSAFSKS